jgi:histone-lysine N-methyltransferase SETMAR
LVDMLCGQMINSDLYIQTLKTWQKHFRRFWPHKNAAEILLQHDNARPPTGLKTQEAITELGQTAPPHPPYSPNTAPSDFHLFGAPKDAIHGKSFGSCDAITEEWRSGRKYRIQTGTRQG